MTIADLPRGAAAKAALEFRHFPNRAFAVIWRNMEFFAPEKLAVLLDTDAATVRDAARLLGAPCWPADNPEWRRAGYLTIIRNNWHLLDYEQLLELLEWSADEFAMVLREDFFFHKLGRAKPCCPRVRWTPPDTAELATAARFRAALAGCVPTRAEAAFAFKAHYGNAPAFPVPVSPEYSFIHSFAAGTGDILAEIAMADPLPETLLERYRELGIKGVWIHAVLRLLVPPKGAESCFPGAALRLENLAKLARRCRKHGLELLLYLNEPRGCEEEFFRYLPAWRGVRTTRSDTYSLCTANPEVLTWLENACRTVFAAAPELGGAFLITMSENPTHCGFALRQRDCPRCRDKSGETLIAEIVAAAERGIHAAKPEARVIASDWAWQEVADDPEPEKFKCRTVALLPENVEVLSISEWGKPIAVGGVPARVVDYSISQVGPAPEACAVWRAARARGLRTVAKLQINNSWELAAVPYLPVPGLIREHLEKIRRENVDALMLSWTQGGWPGGNLALLGMTVEAFAQRSFGRAGALIATVYGQFDAAFREFPFHVGVVYRAPMNFAPMNLFYREPTGYEATMIGFPYDDLPAWRGWSGHYPEAVFEAQFARLAAGWQAGVERLGQAAEQYPELLENPAFVELRHVAMAAGCHWSGTLAQIRFVRARERGDGAAMRAALAAERANVLALLPVAGADSRIGYEASNHYFYTPGNLLEKLANCAAVATAI